MNPPAIRFGLEEAIRASNLWRFNCGPGALCGLLGMTPDEIRPHLLEFERKGYTNPTLMFSVLRGLSIEHRQIYRGDSPDVVDAYPRFGLVRVQWAGPWTNPGVPMAARYRKTHWVAACGEGIDRQIFDVNAVSAGGWMSWSEWSGKLVPWLIRVCEPTASGAWWATHAIEVTPRS